MGRVAAQRLAEMNATLYILGRNPEKTRRVVDDLNRLTEEERAFGISCDLASLASVRACAAALLETCPSIDLLVNCAGTAVWERKISPDVFEMNWAVNYLGPFLLTGLLLDRIKESAPARIVHLSSAMESSGHIHFDDLQLTCNWTALKAVAQAKLATNMATIALARRLEGTGVTVNALHPGLIRTAPMRDVRGWIRVCQPLMRWFASPPEVGAERIIRVALAAEYEDVTGRYVYEDGIRPPNGEALDDAAVERLWLLSEEAVRA
jgi:NAD(P)-dependent dehydrogenase (short-subunit alcohol dehydrogenase family)